MGCNYIYISYIYECKEANHHLQQSASNVVLVDLFNARRIGTLPGYIKNDQLRAAAKMTSVDTSSSRIFGVSGPVRQIPAVISKRVYHGIDDLVSANHCQVGAEGGIFEIIYLNIK